MVQNTSTAVMQRRVASTDALDFYPTPPWATRALCHWFSARYKLVECSAWDPACGEHDMAVPLGEAFRDCYVSDIAPYENNRFSEGHLVADFLSPRTDHIRADFIITNPPFILAEEFALRALDCAAEGVALLVRTTFLETIGRYQRLFALKPPTDILQFSERVVMHHGKLSQKGSTATAYCWAVWLKGAMSLNGVHPTAFHWIPPCRAELERDEDYPAAGVPEWV